MLYNFLSRIILPFIIFNIFATILLYIKIKIHVPKTGYSDINNINIASWNDLVDINKQHLNTIEEESKSIIKKVLDTYGDYSPQILTSGGKDSSVTSYLVRSVNPDIHAIFNNTTLDCADTYLHIKQFPNCSTINPKEGFYQWRERYNIIPNRLTRACCTIFKEGSMVETLPHENKYIFFLGMRNEESDKRSNYEDMWKNNKWSENWQGCLPIRKWTELDIWLYILYRNIDTNSKYRKGYNRAGCAIACPYQVKSMWTLDKYWYPTMRKRWEDILKKDFINNKKWIVMNCTIDEYINQAWNGTIFREEPTEEVIKEYAENEGLDIKIAAKYFNKYCYNGCTNRKNKPLKIKDKNTLAMNMKFHGRDTEKFLCKKCFMNMYDMNEEKWNKYIQDFKMSGCALF